MIALLLLLFAPDLYEEALRDYHQERFQAAEQKLRRLIASGPASFDARFLLGATLVRLERPPEAVAELKRACALNPRHLDAIKLLASEQLKLGEQGEVIARLKAMPDSYSLDEELHLLLLQAYQDRGDVPDHEAAVALARKAVTRFPASAAVRIFLGYELRDLGDLEEARRQLEQAIRLAPDDPQPKALLGDVALKQRRFAEARQLLEQVLARRPQHLQATLSLARALVEMGQPRQAAEILEQAKSWADGEGKLHLELSGIYSRLGDTVRARMEAERFRRRKQP